MGGKYMKKKKKSKKQKVKHPHSLFRRTLNTSGYELMMDLGEP